MSQSTQAKERFLITAYKYATRATENFATLSMMAQRIAEAEAVGFKLDPDSVEQAVKRALCVE